MKCSHQICALALSAAVALSCAPLVRSGGQRGSRSGKLRGCSGGVSGAWNRLSQALGLSAPSIRASSTLSSSADTGEAVMTLEGCIDDSKIDSSHAVVEILPGDGYYLEELVLHADKPDGVWENGSYH